MTALSRSLSLFLALACYVLRLREIYPTDPQRAQLGAAPPIAAVPVRQSVSREGEEIVSRAACVRLCRKERVKIHGMTSGLGWEIETEERVREKAKEDRDTHTALPRRVIKYVSWATEQLPTTPVRETERQR